MAINCVRHISLEINRGFARTAIRELTPKNEEVDKQQRASKFKELYDGCSGFGFGMGYVDEGKNGSMFDRDCTKILQAFNKKWHPKGKRQQYEAAFSLANWKALSADKKGYTTSLSVLHATCNSMTYKWHFLKGHITQNQFYL